MALLAILLVAAATACAGRSTPPGANKYLGSFEQGGYLFLRWQEGLAAGNLFIVHTGKGTPDVRQLDRDLSGVPSEHDGILAFAEKDPDLASFLKSE